MMPAALHLGFLDSAVLIGYVAILASIGWWAARRTAKTTDDYFLASRSIPWLVTAASFTATCISALTFIGTPAVGYSGDYRYLLSNPGDMIAVFFIALVFLPHFQKLRVTSIYQAVAERFGPGARTTCSAYFLVTRTLASTVRIVAIAKVLEVVSGGGLSYNYCVVIVIAGILAYTTIGGGRAIAWTDLMQFTLLTSGAVIALVYIINHVPGGVPTIMDLGKHAVKPDGTVYNKFNFLEMFTPANLGLLVVMTLWGTFNSSAAYGTDQDMAQRLLACNNNRKARWSLILTGIIGIPIAFTFLSIGVGLYAYAHFHPELIAGMTDPDHVFPRFILNVMPHGLRGLMLAAVASAAMGSADSALASLSTVFIMDFYKPFWGKGDSEARIVKISKISFVGFGLLFLVFALCLSKLDSLLWLAFRLVSFTYGPLLGIFCVAVMTNWKLSTWKVLPLMLTPTLLTFGTSMTAWWMATHGGGHFWQELHGNYWQFYIMFGALFVPFGAWLLRENRDSAEVPVPAAISQNA
ncbi:MAG: sodium/solute symporter [Elusimicrobiales bacterium]|nr:sodium/solute symporter [Elusimicrobiales bacterium]